MSKHPAAPFVASRLDGAEPARTLEGSPVRGAVRAVVRWATVLGVAGGLWMVFTGVASASGTADASYTPVAPCVAFDSRSASGAVSPYQGPVTAGQAVAYQVTGSFPATQGGGNTTCGVPAGAVSVHLNLVAIEAQGAGNLRADDGITQGSGGIVNFANLTPPLNTANAANLPLSPSGQLTVRVNCSCTGPAVQVRGIVLGYYTTTLAAKVASLESRIVALEATLAGVTRSGTDLTFTGMNLHLINGAGSTATTNSLGNLIIGYNENPNNVARTGSHTLVVGPNHSWTSYGGAVFGYQNTINGFYSTVTGGNSNTASGGASSITGGYSNTASGGTSSITGGYQNQAIGTYSSVSGGQSNNANNGFSSVTGGYQNNATADDSSVSGGKNNTTNGIYGWVGGGESNTAAGAASSVSGGITNSANKSWSAVSGGELNTANGDSSTVSGGDSLTTAQLGSWIAGRNPVYYSP